MDLSRSPKAAPVRERRRVHRYVVDVAASLSGSSLSKRRKAMLADISLFGCRVKTAGRFYPGDFLMISVPSFGPFGAEIVWATEGVFGVEFVRPLHRAVVQHVLSLRVTIDCPIERRWRSIAE